MRPWLSVLIPTYNGENHLSSALDSVLKQGDPNIECIAVDDGSTDRTLPILETYKKKLDLVSIEQERKGNWVAATNRALSLARGDYISMLHQDDIWYRDRLKAIHSLIEVHPTVNFFLNSADFIDLHGRYLGHWRCPLPGYPARVDSKIILERLLIQNFIAIPAPLVKREAAIAVGGLDESLWYTADWDFWLKLALRYQSVHYSKPLCGFRVHPNSQTETRSAFLNEFRRQQEMVTGKYFEHLNGSKWQQNEIRKASAFSIDVNVAFAGAIHKKKVNLFGLIIKLPSLGPTGIHRYIRDSRIWERSIARIRSRLAFNK